MLMGGPIMWVILAIIAFFFLSRTGGTPGTAPITNPVQPIGPAQPSGGVAAQTSQGGTSNAVFGNTSAVQNGLDAPVATTPPSTIITGQPTGTQICPTWGCSGPPRIVMYAVDPTTPGAPPPTRDNPITTHPLMVTGILRSSPSTL